MKKFICVLSLSLAFPLLSSAKSVKLPRRTVTPPTTQSSGSAFRSIGLKSWRECGAACSEGAKHLSREVQTFVNRSEDKGSVLAGLIGSIPVLKSNNNNRGIYSVGTVSKLASALTVAQTQAGAWGKTAKANLAEFTNRAIRGDLREADRAKVEEINRNCRVGLAH